MIVARPPTAVQITASIENTGPVSRNDTKPTQAAYMAPALAAMKAETQNTKMR